MTDNTQEYLDQFECFMARTIGEDMQLNVYLINGEFTVWQVEPLILLIGTFTTLAMAEEFVTNYEI